MPSAAEKIEREPIELEDQIDAPVEAPDENFSLEMLGAENKEEETPATAPSEQRQQFFEAFTKQSAAHTKGLEASVVEPRKLAEMFNGMDIVNVQSLENYLESKKRQGLFGETSPEELVQELTTIEAKIIVPLIGELKKNDFGLTSEQINNCVCGAREAFYAMILNERLTADKILQILDGKILVKKTPGSEVSKEHSHLQNIAAYLGWDGSRYNIHLYESLFAEENKDIAFLMRHEFFHAAAISIWGERYINFRKAALNPEQNIAAFADIPELQQVLIMVANPETAKPFFRDYIGKLLDAIDAAQSTEDKAFYRQRAAMEIVADLGAHFLEGAKTSDVFLDLRARYFASNPDELVRTICELEGVSDLDQLFENYSINPAETPPQEIIKRLSESEKLQPLFKASVVWQEELTKKFENKGIGLKRPDIEEMEIEEGSLDEAEIAPGIPVNQNFIGQSAPTAGSAGSGGQGIVKGILDIWEILTGGGKKAP